MRPVQAWFDEYAESHINPVNKLIHWLCVPAIAVSIVGLLWVAPVPPPLQRISPYLNWGTLFLGAATIYYIMLSLPLGLGMALGALGVAATLNWASTLPTPLWQVCVVLFVVAWVGQFIGHIIEGKRPSFFQDIQYLMIGPVWLLGFVYRRLGIRY